MWCNAVLHSIHSARTSTLNISAQQKDYCFFNVQFSWWEVRQTARQAGCLPSVPCQSDTSLSHLDLNWTKFSGGQSTVSHYIALVLHFIVTDITLHSVITPLHWLSTLHWRHRHFEIALNTPCQGTILYSLNREGVISVIRLLATFFPEVNPKLYKSPGY